MAIMEAAPVTDVQGGIIALAFAIACLALRAWLTSPQRRFRRLVLLSPPSPVLPDQTSEDDEVREDDLGPDWDEALDETAARPGARPRMPAVGARSACDGGN